MSWGSENRQVTTEATETITAPRVQRISAAHSAGCICAHCCPLLCFANSKYVMDGWMICDSRAFWCTSMFHHGTICGHYNAMVQWFYYTPLSDEVALRNIFYFFLFFKIKCFLHLLTQILYKSIVSRDFHQMPFADLLYMPNSIKSDTAYYLAALHRLIKLTRPPRWSLNKSWTECWAKDTSATIDNSGQLSKWDITWGFEANRPEPTRNNDEHKCTIRVHALLAWLNNSWMLRRFVILVHCSVKTESTRGLSQLRH